MPDVATLGIKVENGEVVKATTSLEGLTVAGAKTEAAAQRLTRRMALLEIQAREMDGELGRGGRTMALLEIEARKMDAEFGQTTRAMGLLEIEARKMNDAMDQATHAVEHGTAAHEPHIHGLSRIGNSLAALVGHATGVPPVIEKIADALAIMSFGHLATVGVLAGFAAVAFAYEKITEKAREAAKEAEKTRAAISEAANAGQTDPIREAARKLQFGEPFDKEHKPVPLSEFATGAFEGSLADLQGKLRKLQEQFYATTNGFTQLQIQKQIIGVKQSLAPMERLMEDMRLAAANVANQPGENAGTLGGVRTEALSQEAIKRAREKAEKEAAEEAERIFKASIDQRADEWNHFVAEQRATYKQASEDTVRDFEQEQDRETAIALEQQNEQTRAAKAAAKEQTDATIREFERMEKYRDDMNKEWRRGLARIITDGLTSFRSFFNEVFNLFSRLMARMEQEKQTGTFAYKALAAGSAAIGGAFAGYGIGQATANRGLGAFGGAAAGALAGSAILPGIGTAVGALAGAAGGLLGASHAQEEAAEALRLAAEQFRAQADIYVAESTGDAEATKVAQETARFKELASTLDRLYHDNAISFTEWFQQANELVGAFTTIVDAIHEAAALAKQNAKEDLDVRTLRNKGLTKEADLQAKINADAREYAEAAKAGMDPAYLALLKWNQGMEEAATVMNKASSAALNMVEGYRLQAEVFRQMPAQSQPFGSGGLFNPTRTERTGGSITNPPIIVESVVQLDGREIARSSKEIYKSDARRRADGDDSVWGRD
jgi:hypothetical protein